MRASGFHSEISASIATQSGLLFLDARAAKQAAPIVASIMAPLLNKDEAWQKAQVNSFKELANNYIVNKADE